ncbi:UNVERIFIED_CONTAM: hypothetical protein PYX00_002360 [Menopon gallinae]|uniref:Prosaposin n=1 Tax=Menopon gallinae TaxID=328185 RepID=A0AAW2IGL7_9NEOP
MILKWFLGLLLVNFVVAFSPRGLLGDKQCSWGPSFWCGNITNAKNCHAVKHCIQTVWQHKVVAEDNDDICTICKDMVKQARAQLESNETIDDIKKVFEGTCKFMRIKPVVKECIHFADEYAVELVDMLSSFMNPQVVCALAGLCNNNMIDQMLEDIAKKNAREDERNKELQKNCEPCMEFAETLEKKFERATEEDIKQYLLDRCGSFGSYSDSCANLVDEYSQDIYNKLKNDFTAASFCSLTASCINGYSRKVQVKTESDVGVIHLNSDAISAAVKHMSDDKTCELCKVLVKHLRDLLTLNTTETEFKIMLKNICKQTGRFRSECLALTDEYYDQLYHYILHDLNGSEMCKFAKICTDPNVYVNGPIAPLLPELPLPNRGIQKLGRISVAKSDAGVKVFAPAVHSPVRVEISFGDPLESKFQLPIERMGLVPQPQDLAVNGKEACVFCQYLLHYVQKAITQPTGEKALKDVVDHICEKLPQSVTVQCKNFVEQFGDTFVAILAQEIDPSQVCPSLHICPARILENKYEQIEIVGRPGCPLCLLAVEDIKEQLKDNKTEESIRHALHGLCTRMPKNLKYQCDELVEHFSEQIIDMMLADFTPQEVCRFLKLCPTNVDVELVAPVQEKHEVLTNEIPRDEVDATVEISDKTPPTCYLCEFVMDKIEEGLGDNRTEDDVRRVVSRVCSYMPKSIEQDCRNFVKKYRSYIIQMLEDNVDPKMVCQEMHMCKEKKQAEMNRIRQAVQECALCEALVGAVRGLLEDKQFDRNMANYASQICAVVPGLRPYQRQRCESMAVSYGPSIINLLVEFEVRPALVCPRIGLCDETEQTKVHVEESSTEHAESHPQRRPHLVGGNSCTWGPSYWCQSEDHAIECGTLAHCREMVWKAERPTPAV